MPSSNPTTEEIATARSQFILDKAAGLIPEFSTTDQAAAQAFVDYVNSLIRDKPTIKLVTKTTYSISKI